MTRTCFVIMPFSQTASCDQQDWTWIFENLFKPAIEGAGLDYECKRSVATRGNLVALILEDLRDSYVVLADLTDQNANVFYELGVRHCLKDRTILLAQRNDDIPFDLRAYAYHIYDWRTDDGKGRLIGKIRELLADVDDKPNRKDNPVSDFLGRLPQSTVPTTPVTITPEETAFAQPLVGAGSEGVNATEFARRLARTGNPQAARTVFRLTRANLQPLLRLTLTELNQEKSSGSVPRDQIATRAQPYISKFEPLIPNIEQFVWASIDEGWEAGAKLALEFAGDWITLSEQSLNGNVIRYAQGAPALLAWRLLVLSGAKALSERNFSLLAIVVREPFEVEHSGSMFTNLSLIKHNDLFFPEAFLGYADFGAKYLVQLWRNQPYIGDFFGTEAEYNIAVAQFLMVLALASSPLQAEGSKPIYPMYHFFPQKDRAMSALCSRVANNTSYRQGLEMALGDYGKDLLGTWADRAKVANDLRSGSQHYFLIPLQFPENLNSNNR